MSSRESTAIDLASLVAGVLPARQVPAGRWPAIVALALDHGLGPMLDWTVRRSAAAGAPVDLSMESRLRASGRAAIIHAMLLGQAQCQIQVALGRAGIPALWLKGVPLARTVYPEPFLRPMIDLDLLVPYDRRLAALQSLESVGFHRSDAFAYDALPQLVHRFAYNYSLRGGADDAVAVELHFHLLDRVRQRSPLSLEQVGWFWNHTLAVDDADPPFLTLRPEAHLLYLCAHLVLQHGETDWRLLRYLDLHLLIRRYAMDKGGIREGDQAPPDAEGTRGHLAASLDWHLVVEQAIALGWTYAVDRALARTTALFGTPVPAEVLEELRRRRPPNEDVSCIVERQARTSRWDDLRLVSSGMSRHEQLLLLRALAFPSTRHLRSRYALDSTGPVWPYYVRLWFDQGRDLAKWAWDRLSWGARPGQSASR
jgi:hypothetical protein